MASSEVEICNSALVKLGEERISSLDDPGKAARTCKRQYPLKRDQLLEDYNWTFAIKRIALSADGADPEFGFEARFLLPADCLRFLGLYDPNALPVNYTGTNIAHKIEGRYLLLDDTAANIFYIQRVTNVLEFSPSFAEALACFLAWDMAYDLTGSSTREQRLEAMFAHAIRRARFTQAIQGQPELIEASEWMDARQQGGVIGRIGPVA